ncbi:MAG: inorganic phosphate transporter [Cellvibrionales bacterium]|nr:inorganic phosphate transporter [Cellvibrionales bacterium]
MAITEHFELLMLLAILATFFMAWGVGANDAANAIATSVGSKAITLKHALIIAIIFEFLGAFFAGGEVTQTIRKGIIDPDALTGKGDVLILGMLASLLAAGSWLFIASYKGWPVSTTHSIVGAIVGFGAWVLGIDTIYWSKVGIIVSSWIVSPLLAGIIAFLLFSSVKKLILDNPDTYHAATRLVPVYILLTGFIIAMITLTKGLKHIGLDLTIMQSIIFSFAIGLLMMMVGIFFIKRIDRFTHHGQMNHPVERIFSLLMVFTACSMAFAHGSNDVANAVGPLAAIFGVLQNNESVSTQSVTTHWILLIGALGISIGLITMGYRVMATVGQRITALSPSHGFAAELSAATSVVIASGTGLPISTTHTLIGAIIGVGLVHGRQSLNWKTLISIGQSWLITIPAGGFLAILFYYVLAAFFLG